MRYIGNKTKLLHFIGDVLVARQIRGGCAVDPFTGTASVARELKRRGFRVIASDIMHYGYTFARAYVEVTAPPVCSKLAEELGLATSDCNNVVAFLNAIEPNPGFVHEHYSPAGGAGGEHGRMYFTPDNAARIDAIRSSLQEWRDREWIDIDAYYTLLAALLEAADRVANTTGVYAAFVKSWQPNAVRPLALRMPAIVCGNSCHARRADALAVVRAVDEFELLYLDPPYNTRQYAGYYHIPELIAEGWFGKPVETRGKTGLVHDADKRSDWSRGQKCELVFEELIASARCKHIVMSYNAEGIIPEATIERVMKTYGCRASYHRYKYQYRRYRSDADGENRRYRGDSVHEFLYCISR